MDGNRSTGTFGASRPGCVFLQGRHPVDRMRGGTVDQLLEARPVDRFVPKWSTGLPVARLEAIKLIEKKIQLNELDLNINFNRKIDKAEENLTQKIGENSARLTNVEETLANHLKAQQEQNATNKALTDFLGRVITSCNGNIGANGSAFGIVEDTSKKRRSPTSRSSINNDEGMLSFSSSVVLPSSLGMVAKSSCGTGDSDHLDLEASVIREADSSKVIEPEKKPRKRGRIPADMCRNFRGYAMILAVRISCLALFGFFIFSHCTS
ncbi:hypothetical protein Dimus_008144 [Dionaea muscipula]